jgi:hypothetical protein
MQLRNDQPNVPGFNFSTFSLFNNMNVMLVEPVPILLNEFLLLPSPLDFFLLLDGSEFLLLGT